MSVYGGHFIVNICVRVRRTVGKCGLKIVRKMYLNFGADCCVNNSIYFVYNKSTKFEIMAILRGFGLFF